MGPKIPFWFVEKYEGWVNFRENRGEKTFPLSSKFEEKVYREPYIVDDIQKIMVEDDDFGEYPVSLIWLHEDELIAIVKIYKNGILCWEPEKMKEAEYIGTAHPELVNKNQEEQKQ
jgi:hypothetical protein